MDENKLTLREAAERLGLTARALRHAVHAGTLKAERREIPQGHYYVVTPEEVERYRIEHQGKVGRPPHS